MNHKEYLNLLSGDLNIILSIPKALSAHLVKKEHLFRLQVLILHLHTDYLMNEILTRKLNLNIWRFSKKLNAICERTGPFTAGLFDTLTILNDVRNRMSHDLVLDLRKQENKIQKLDIPLQIKDMVNRNLSADEHLIFGCVGYVLLLAQFLYEEVYKENIKNSLQVEFKQLVPNGPKFPLFSLIDLTEELKK